MAGIRDIARRAHIKPEQVTAVFDALKAICSEDEEVRVVGFGTFQPNIKESRAVHSPVLPGGKGVSPRRRQIRYIMSKSLKQEWVLS